MANVVVDDAVGGGIRQDFKVNLLSDIDLRWVTKDKDGANVTDMAGWTGAFYLLNEGDRETVDGITALSTEALVEKAASFAAPNTDVALLVADQAGLSRGLYEYELWRTDTNNNVRLAFGFIEFTG